MTRIERLSLPFTICKVEVDKVSVLPNIKVIHIFKVSKLDVLAQGSIPNHSMEELHRSSCKLVSHSGVRENR